jgi:hypothetical protein
LTIRLYDILKGKDTWSKQFPAGSTVLTTENENITGVIDPAGLVTVLDAHTGNVLASSNMVQGRIPTADVRGLQNPLLLQDGDHYYVALNKPVDKQRISQGLLHNNFHSSARCLPVNGWFVAIHRHDGKRALADREISWKKGDLAWFSFKPIENQLIVVDQFEQLPVLLFSVRVNETRPNGTNEWKAVTLGMNKTNGKYLYDSGARQFHGSPLFVFLQLDMKSRSVFLVGYSGSVRLYVDDGKGAPPLPQFGALGGNPGAEHTLTVPQRVPVDAEADDFIMRRRRLAEVEVFPLDPPMIPVPIPKPRD